MSARKRGARDYDRGRYRARGGVDASDYDRSKYASHAEDPEPFDPFAPQTHDPNEWLDSEADEAREAYSRKNAADRYRGMKRHASSGEARLEHAVERGGAAVKNVGGFRKRKLVIAVLVVLIAAIAIWYVQVSAAMRPSEDVSGSVSAPGVGQPYYVLLLGSDSRAEGDEVARADSIILTRVDERAKKVTMVSMPRDLLVDIEGHGRGKLNSALAYNGFGGMIDAVSDVAGVPISYYAVIYFSGFEQLVDDLGGVTVEVPEGTYYDGVWVPAGEASRINGQEALVLARCRHGNPPDQGAYAAGDYQRTKNQRNLMKAIVKEIMGQPVVFVPGQVLTVSKCIETNMSAAKLAQVALAMRGMSGEEMYSATAPAYGEYIDGVSYQILDDAEWSAMMARVEAGQDPNG